MMRDWAQVPVEVIGRQVRPAELPVSVRREYDPVSAWDRLRPQLSRGAGSSAAGPMLALQRRLGNRWVQRALERENSSSGEAEVQPEVQAGIARKRGGGEPLEAKAQTEMESAFGADFSGVRVHTDGESDHLNRRVNAVAFTTGNDVFFSQGTYAPGTSAGRELLAHELTHVVQQGGSGSAVQGKLTLGEPGSAHERDAEAMGRAVSSTPVDLQRECACGGGGDCDTCHKERDKDGERSLLRASSKEIRRYPGDAMEPPGDCSMAKYVPLHLAVETAKAAVNALGGCKADDSCELLAVKIAAVTAEIVARVAINTMCFKGGDAGHREAVQVKVNQLNNCWKFFSGSGINCPKIMAEKAAKAAATAAALALAAKATLTQIGEAATVAGEAVEGVEAGATVGEVVEGLLLVLAL